jgi:hypothetical protein
MWTVKHLILQSGVWSEREEKYGVTHVVALLPSLASGSGSERHTLLYCDVGIGIPLPYSRNPTHELSNTPGPCAPPSRAVGVGKSLTDTHYISALRLMRIVAGSPRLNVANITATFHAADASARDVRFSNACCKPCPRRRDLQPHVRHRSLLYQPLMEGRRGCWVMTTTATTTTKTGDSRWSTYLVLSWPRY